MNTRNFALNALATLTLILAFASVIQAQGINAYVAETGTDTLFCWQSAPCRTIDYALGYTGNGEVVILDSGRYQNFTVRHPATVTAAPGVRPTIYAGAPGEPAIRVQNGLKVVLRGLKLAGSSSGIGISNGLPDGSDSRAHLNLHVEDCVIHRRVAKARKSFQRPV